MKHNKLLILFGLGISILSHADGYKKLSNSSASGLEFRVNLLGSSGRFQQDFVIRDVNANDLESYQYTSDLTTKGTSLLVGYAREYRRQKQSSYLYLGYESQKWNDGYESVYHAAILGLEGGVGGPNIKFIYGGEFAVGTLDTGLDDLGYLATFTAEPFVGMRVLLIEHLNLNLRVGARFYSIESVESLEGVNTLLSQNSAYTANAQIGFGYSFY